MANIEESIKQRFSELAEQAKKIPSYGHEGRASKPEEFYAWASSALHVIKAVFGKESSHYTGLTTEISQIDRNYVDERKLGACIGIFLGAKSDIDGGHIYTVTSAITGELFGDMVALAKSALAEGNHTVACVLACAALEDALKRYATSCELDVEGKTMEQVVNALKSQGLVSGAQKALLSALPKVRNYAMHADWNNLTPQDAASVIGYVEHFLLEHFG